MPRSSPCKLCLCTCTMFRPSRLRALFPTLLSEVLLDPSLPEKGSLRFPLVRCCRLPGVDHHANTSTLILHYPRYFRRGSRGSTQAASHRRLWFPLFSCSSHIGRRISNPEAEALHRRPAFMPANRRYLSRAARGSTQQGEAKQDTKVVASSWK